MAIHVTYKRGVPSEMNGYADDAANATIEVGLPKMKFDSDTMDMVKTGLFGYLALASGAPLLFRLAAGYFAWGGLGKILAKRPDLVASAREVLTPDSEVVEYQ